MNPAEAARLLGHAAAFDNRTVGEADATAWAAALHDLPMDPDTLAAVARYYAEPTKDGETGRRWLEPHHVKAWRKRIRAERLGETIPAYEPMQPDETGAQFVARRRAQLKAIADGRLQAIPVRELTGGPHPSVADALAGAGQMPAHLREQLGRATRDPEMAIACPKAGCRARERQPCTTPRGQRRSDTHQARKDAINEQEQASA